MKSEAFLGIGRIISILKAGRFGNRFYFFAELELQFLQNWSLNPLIDNSIQHQEPIPGAKKIHAQPNRLFPGMDIIFYHWKTCSEEAAHP